MCIRSFFSEADLRYILCAGVTVLLCAMAISLLGTVCHAPTLMLANFVATPIELRYLFYVFFYGIRSLFKLRGELLWKSLSILAAGPYCFHGSTVNLVLIINVKFSEK